MAVVADLRPLRNGAERLRPWAIASVIGNAGLIITGGIVRLTKSGLGCPTWPLCSDSFLPDPAVGGHGVIEVGNRMLTFVLIALAIGTFVSARRCTGLLRDRATKLAIGVGLGIVGQAVVGGISVLTMLNPWIVGLHLVLSLIIVGLTVGLLHLTSNRVPEPLPARGRTLALVVVALGFIAMALGTVVTGAGPNSGDNGVRRNGLDIVVATRIHAAAVGALIALTLIALWVLRKTRAGAMLRGVLIVEILQAFVGTWQSLTGMPVALVIVHMVLVAVLAVALAHLFSAIAAQSRPDRV